MSWDYFTHARTLELLYHKLQSPVLTRYRMTQIELDVLLFLANHPGLDTAKDIVEIRRLTKSHVSAAVEGLSQKGYLLRVRRPDNRKLIHLTLLPEAAPVVADGQASQQAFSRRWDGASLPRSGHSWTPFSFGSQKTSDRSISAWRRRTDQRIWVFLNCSFWPWACLWTPLPCRCARGCPPDGSP